MKFFKKVWGLFKERLGNIFIHPQYLTLKFRKKEIEFLTKYIKGITIDIGSGSQWYKDAVIKKTNSYISLDYPPTSKLYEETYGKKPHIYGDARKLCIKSSAIDTVLFLDVIEHIDDPEAALREINRILKDEGIFCFSVPFLYPLHDIPYDYRRWTVFGIQDMMKKNNFQIIEYVKRGNFGTIWGIFFNLNLMYIIQKIIGYKFFFKWILLLFLFPLIFIFSILMNILALILEKTVSSDRFTLGYTVVAKKNVCKNYGD